MRYTSPSSKEISIHALRKESDRGEWPLSPTGLISTHALRMASALSFLR